MAFAGILQPFERLRWIRFGLLMRAVSSGAGLLLLNFYVRLLTFYPVLLEIKRSASVANESTRFP